MVEIQVYLKCILTVLFVGCEFMAVRMQWNYLKGAYALKLIQIIFAICEVSIDRTP